MVPSLRFPILRFHTPTRTAACLLLFASPAFAQTKNSPPGTPIGSIQNPASTQTVSVSGAITLAGPAMLLGNGSTVTAGLQTVAIQLTRGGTLSLCATTQLRLSQSKSSSDSSAAPITSGALMMSLDRGALEEHASIGKDSDVILTPDLRILISGPGQADLRLRVNAQGDTCVENHLDHPDDIAPYVTVSEQLSDGVYRVQPNQRVLFEQGSLRSVVDHEPEPCGCPTAAPLSVASSGVAATPAQAAAGKVAAPGQTVSTQSTTSYPNANPDTAFPIAESEGLAPPPAAPTQPVVAPGQTHVEVATTLTYDANHPNAQQNSADAAASFGSVPSRNVSSGAAPSGSIPAATASSPVPVSTTAQAPVTAQALPPAHKAVRLLRHIGHFFKRLFGPE